MQKFIDMKSLGTKLQIISAFSVDHIKGFFYIEADKQCDINEVSLVLGHQKMTWLHFFYVRVLTYLLFYIRHVKV